MRQKYSLLFFRCQIILPFQSFEPRIAEGSGVVQQNVTKPSKSYRDTEVINKHIDKSWKTHNNSLR